MTVTGIDHVLVLSDDIDAAREFYCAALGLASGERPPLGFAGHWLYARRRAAPAQRANRGQRHGGDGVMRCAPR